MKCLLLIAVLFLFASCGKEAENGGITPQAKPEIVSESSYFMLPYEFSATDLYGNTVTQETLGEKQVFFVHLWATWCGPCVRGMPDLAEAAQTYGDSVGFLGLVSDYDSNLDGAISIIESAGMPDSFIMIDANEPSAAHLREMVRTGFVPATVLITIDNLSPEPLTGRNYAELLDEVLP
ncbi:MAG: TlpA family protein disulfide reductase [Oscillospiraceae bacterium]|nr:TlpA family protein disulfide reductase [Oscillospiraceae bacterium]